MNIVPEQKAMEVHCPCGQHHPEIGGIDPAPKAQWLKKKNEKKNGMPPKNISKKLPFKFPFFSDLHPTSLLLADSRGQDSHKGDAVLRCSVDLRGVTGFFFFFFFAMGLTSWLLVDLKGIHFARKRFLNVEFIAW